MQEEPEVKNFLPEDSGLRMTPWTILFLDSVENVKRLTEGFKDAGYAVVGATTIEDAWACLEGKDRVDAIVCAPHLENGSMFEFLQDVRNSKLHGNTKFIILSLAPGAMSARLDNSTASAGLALGADAYCNMPVLDPSKLVALIKKLETSVPVLQQSAPAEENVGHSKRFRASEFDDADSHPSKPMHES
jgi:CheY-like chemotaxis protein